MTFTEELRVMIVDLSQTKGKEMEVPIDSSTSDVCKTCIAGKTSHMRNPGKGMGKQRESIRTMGNLRAEKKIMFMTQAARGRLVVSSEIRVKAQPWVEVRAAGQLPAASFLLQIAMQQGISGKNFSKAIFLRSGPDG
jgi:hypothetical protein